MFLSLSHVAVSPYYPINKTGLRGKAVIVWLSQFERLGNLVGHKKDQGTLKRILTEARYSVESIDAGDPNTNARDIERICIKCSFIVSFYD